MHLYLWGFTPAEKLVVMGPYDSQNDKKYGHDIAIMQRGGVRPQKVELSTRDQGVATQIIKHRAMEGTSRLQTGLDRAQHAAGGRSPVTRGGAVGAGRAPARTPVGAGEPEVRYVED